MSRLQYARKRSTRSYFMYGHVLYVRTSNCTLHALYIVYSIRIYIHLPPHDTCIPRTSIQQVVRACV